MLYGRILNNVCSKKVLKTLYSPQQNRTFIKNCFDKVAVTEFVKNAENANKLFYGNERDMENYPALKLRKERPAVRLGLIPKAWFDFMYDKTGVSGPYFMVWGSLLVAMSKEVIIVNIPFIHMIMCTGTVYLGLRMYGDKVTNYLTNELKSQEESTWIGIIKANKKQADVKLGQIDDLVSEVKCVFSEIEAKKENVQFQLEAKYRQNLLNLHNEVKKRLDYQVDKKKAIENFKLDHMVKSVVANVISSITPQMEKDNIMSCIAQIKNLSPTK